MLETFNSQQTLHTLVKGINAHMPLVMLTFQSQHMLHCNKECQKRDKLRKSYEVQRYRHSDTDMGLKLFTAEAYVIQNFSFLLISIVSLTEFKLLQGRRD